MGTTLSNGYKKPEKRDSDWWDQLISNIERINAHEHDGVNSDKISSGNVTKSTATIADTEWGSDLGGSTYTKSMTMPDGYVFDNTVIYVFETDGGDQIYPTITKTAESTFNLTVNDNTLNLKVIYA